MSHSYALYPMTHPFDMTHHLCPPLRYWPLPLVTCDVTRSVLSIYIEKVHSLYSLVFVRADCLATNTEYCDRCTHATTQATNVAQIKTEGTKGLLQGQVAVLESGWIKLACRRPIKSCG